MFSIRLTPRVGFMLLGFIAAVGWLSSPASGSAADDGAHDWPSYGDVDRDTPLAAFTAAQGPSGQRGADAADAAGKVPPKSGQKSDVTLQPHHRDDGPLFYADTSRGSFDQATTVNCVGDGQAGPRVQAIYLRATGAPDNFAGSRPQIINSMSEANDIVRSAATSRGSARNLRYVHNTACEPVVIRETVSAAALNSFGVMISELQAKGYTTAQRTWLIYADSNAYCGIGQAPADDRGWPNNVLAAGDASLFARVDTFCWDPVTVAHELFHTFGAVHDNAPGSNRAGHCNDGEDVMCYAEPAGVGTYSATVCPGNNSTLLDCQHDTYFDPAPEAGSYLATNWNTADSVYLQGGRDPVGGGTTPPPPPTDDPVGDPPANDTIAGATALTSGQSAPADNRGATAEPGEPSHAGVSGANSVWYSITATAGQTITVTVSNSSFDPVAALYTRDGSTLTAVAANDDSEGVNPFLQITAPRNGTYLIAVAGFQSSRGTATVTAHVTPAGVTPPPNPGQVANDNLANAVPLSDGQTSAFDLTSATAELGEPNHHGVGGVATVWYRVDAPAGTGVTLDVTSNFDPVAAMYTLPAGGGVQDLQLVISNDDSVGVQPRLWTESTGQPLYIAIAGFNESRGAGSVQVRLGGERPEADGANDTFSSATPVAGAGGQFTIDTVGATAEAGEPRHLDSGENSVWFAISAPAGEVVSINMSTDFDPVAAAYVGASVDRLTLVAADDDSGLGFQPRLQLSHPGQTLYLAVAGFGNAQGRGTLTVTIGGGNDAAVSRIAGSDRVLTAIAAAQTTYPDGGAPAVVLTTSGDFPDALAGGPFSASLGAPILLTRSSTLEQPVLDEISRLQPEIVYLLGGPNALAPAVESALQQAGFATERLAGAGRAETATAVSAFFQPGVEFVHVVNGRDWRAAMMAGGHAGLYGEPVLLLEPTSIPATTVAEIQRLAPTGIVVHNIGGEISPEVIDEMSQHGEVYLNAGPAAADVGATLVAISGVPAVIAAADHNFPDGLSAGQFGLPVILVPQTGPVSAVLLDALRTHGITDVLVMGGRAAVAEDVARQLGG